MLVILCLFRGKRSPWFFFLPFAATQNQVSGWFLVLVFSYFSTSSMNWENLEDKKLDEVNLFLSCNVDLSPPPVCCQTGHSCWCPGQSASDPARTERRPGCCLWQPSAAGWWPPHVPTPLPASHPECAAVPGKAALLGLPSRGHGVNETKLDSGC